MTTLQNTSRARARRACAGAALLLCLAAGSTAQAGALYPFDPGFHGGSFIGESFGTATGWYQGRAIAPLSNDRFVAVGMVPRWNQNNAANGHNNIGLSRYDGSGSIGCWSNPGVYGVGPTPGICVGASADPYIDYDNSATPNKEGVRAVLVRNGFIYVLTDQVDLNRNGPGSNNVELQVFKETGEFVDWETVFGAGTNDQWDIYGAALTLGPVINGQPTLMAVGTAYPSGSTARIIINRLVIGADNNAWQDPTFGISYSDGGNRYITVTPPDSYCAAGQALPCHMRAERAVFAYAPQQGLPDSLYIGASGRYLDNGTDYRDWNPVVLKINPASTVPDSNFGNGGWASTWFNDPNSDFNDRLVGLVVKQGAVEDDVYVTTQVSRQCADGIGVARFGMNGQLEPAFGNGGKLLFGGSAGVGILCPTMPGQPALVGVYPMDIAMHGNRIAIAGDQGFSQGGATWWDPMLAVVDTGGNVLQSPTSYEFADSGGTLRNAVLYDVMANADGSFTAIGDVDLGGRYGFAIGRFADDTIFRNGFD